MDVPVTTTSPGVLLVSDAADELVAEFHRKLAEAGARVELVDSVYAAVARLANDVARDIALVLADLRTSDRVEQRIFQITRQYFPHVAAASIAAAPRVGPTMDAVPLATVAQAVDRVRSLLGNHHAAPPAAPQPLSHAVDETLAPSPTDAPAVNETAAKSPAEPSLSLHDAVRSRMSQDSPAPVVRRPPQRVAPTPQPLDLDVEVGSTPAAADSALTPDEINALLQSESPPREEPA